MILIKNIEIVEVPGSQIEIINQREKRLIMKRLHLETPIIKDFNLTKEMVYGRRYRTVDNREIVIGMSKHVQKTIGLTYEAFDNLRNDLERQIDILINTTHVHKEYKAKIKNMNFRNRLKALFYGYK